MDQEHHQYAEDFGLFFARFGQPRMVGRVLGALLLADPPELTAQELTDFLDASRGSISQATQRLVDLGWVQRLSRRGERRDYYRVKPNAWGELMRLEIDATSTLRDFAERGLAIQNSPNQDARRGLEEMRDYYLFRERELPKLLERWEDNWKNGQS